MYNDIRFLSSRAQIKQYLCIPYSLTKLDQILKPSRLKTNTYDQTLLFQQKCHFKRFRSSNLTAKYLLKTG